MHPFSEEKLIRMGDTTIMTILLILKGNKIISSKIMFALNIISNIKNFKNIIYIKSRKNYLLHHFLKEKLIQIGNLFMTIF